MAGFDVAVWIASGLLAFVYLGAGSMKVFAHEKMQAQGETMASLKPNTIRLIGVGELLGVVGLIVPPATNILPWLAGAAAVGLVVVQTLAIPRHIKFKETQTIPMNSVLLLLAAFVALARFGAIP